MMLLIIQSLYFMLPAYAANMAPVVFAWIPWGGQPIDGGEIWRGRRILGDHKTWRGLFAGLAVGIAAVFAQQQISVLNKNFILELVPYGNFSGPEIMLWGTALGGGALIGDLVKSFVKRRIGVAPGKPWIIFDQLDFVFGALVAVSPLYLPPWPHLALIVVATPLLHLLTNVTAYFLGLKRVWW